ncbi:MAG TPA: methyl-accepting chemotaxis protein [Phycisphaerales bacterium]|nr:methyl-accepting chemotaxis protein [Phycisphaerales bacterium]HCD32941.1 methyl-accepting chemotaxis protein [Phycisphaerales bacterium]|tara:strand:- start:1656 stop:3215 length:1560 start_codon:yes stop_codon:yes gene_type:complete
MKIKTKVIGMALAIILLSAVGGSMVIWNMVKANEQFAYFADVCWPSTDMVMETDIEQMAALRMILHPELITDKAQFTTDTKAIIQELDEEWGNSVHDPARVKQIRALLAQFTSQLDSALAGENIKEFVAMSNELSDILEATEGEYDVVRSEHSANARKTLASASFVSIASVVACTLVGIFLAFVMAAQINRPIRKTINMLKDMAEGEGDLTQRIDDTRKDELGELGHWFNTFVGNIQTVIREAISTSGQVSSAAHEIAATSEQMATGMRDQSMQASQISSAIEQMGASVTEVAHQSSDASTNAQEAGSHASTGRTIVRQTIEGMKNIANIVNDSATAINELGQRSEQIGQIIDVINDIADQTNLLALNAAIEAARAGEHGRGFAVVADEVRKLAERTTTATKEVAQSIEDIQNQTKSAVSRMSQGTQSVEEGVEAASQADEALQRIVTSSNQVTGMIQNIASAAKEQTTASDQISSNINSINSVTQQSATGITQTATAAHQLSGLSEQLQQLVGRFKVD